MGSGFGGKPQSIETAVIPRHELPASRGIINWTQITYFGNTRETNLSTSLLKQHTQPTSQDASDVHPRLRRQAPVHPQEGRPRAGHKVGAPRALLAGRQVVEAEGHAEEAVYPASDAAELVLPWLVPRAQKIQCAIVGVKES